MSKRVIGFSELEEADLFVDAVYEGGSFGDIRDDPLNYFLNCGNQGGFRPAGKFSDGYHLTVLYSSLLDPDWPDSLDYENGLFTYYGDNKRPGHELHDTPKGGNKLLRYCFDAIHSSSPRREKVPPFFIFTKGTKGRDVVFRGLAAPGSPLMKPTEDLLAVWKSSKDERFQNYQAIFTILNVSYISRAWISELLGGNTLGEHCPSVWRVWVEKGEYDALRAEPTITHRTKAEQLPISERNRSIVNAVYEHFTDDSHGFEKFAAKLVTLMDSNVVSCDVTRPWRDGGRDAMGLYRIGHHGDDIKVEFALEAKCFKPGSVVGVKPTSRLISRLKYRQFGFLVTTSYVGDQAYKEIREDGHPVVVIAANDIANVLVDVGISTALGVSKWLETNFSK